MDKMKNLANIYTEYVDLLFIYGTNLGFDREIVKDSIHDIFVKIALENNILSRVDNIKFYLLKSLKNRLFDIHRSVRKELSLDKINPEDDMQFIIDVNVENLIIEEEDKTQIKERIQNMLNILTDRQREIIYLRYVQEYDYEQISQLLEISVHGCRKLMSRAILTLREKFICLMSFLII
ncbi:MAG: sigma-70 family RNA polymerase sigma factor [Fermentimonas sp.]|nr:sigma-70 family RNA polymerase sigma factor [Fermentimonas sp.]